MIEHFDQEGNDISIRFVEGETSYTEGEVLIDWAAADKAKAVTTRGFEGSPNFITLGHEMAHGMDSYNYKVSSWIPLSRNRSVSESEVYATHIENMIRAESGLPLRTHYLAQKGGVGYSYSTLIDKKGNSVFFNSNGTRNVFNNPQSVKNSWNISKGASGGVILENRYNYYTNHKSTNYYVLLF